MSVDPEDTIAWAPPREVPRGEVGTPDPRYELLGRLGSGSMGDVLRVRDRVLNRVVAMKILSRRAREETALRFKAEAQATAQLQHPGIVPIYDVGQGQDGRMFYTMKEVQGQTLRKILIDLHDASGTWWEATDDGWTLRRVIDCYLRVCEAMAFAHDRGVMHRDIKPANVMVGDFGETLVVDWGLAKVVGTKDDRLPHEELVYTDLEESSIETSAGAISGTPGYMPPEQALGLGEIGPFADVYALGTMLYEILSGQLPYHGRNAIEVLRKLVAGPPMPVRTRTELPLPDALVVAVESAMARRIKDRPTAAELVAMVGAWLDGEQAREEALEMLARADEMLPQIARTQRDAAEAARRARELGGVIAANAPIEEKAGLWEAEDRAHRLSRDVRLTELDYVDAVQDALSRHPELSEAHQRLADFWVQKHRQAEKSGDVEAALDFEQRIRLHHEGRYTRYLSGEGRLVLDGPRDRPVLLARLEEHGRRMVPVDPLPVRLPQDRPLAMGSWLVTQGPVQVPIFIERSSTWSQEITPPPGLGPDDVYVCAGPGIVGDSSDPDNPRRSLHIPAFVIRRNPVTNARFVAFLDDLVAQGREDEALRWVPRERANNVDQLGAMLYDFDGRHFSLGSDSDGDVWDPMQPVVMVSWEGARAYAAWEAERTGQPWRLPWELEWERAARGVDGRRYPWGHHFDATWACIRDSHHGKPKPARIDAYPHDVSIYGVVGMCGNIEEWCLDAASPTATLPEDREQEPAEATYRQVRGAMWLARPGGVDVARRAQRTAGNRLAVVGFRLVRSV